MTIQDFCRHFTDIVETRVVSPYWQSCAVITASEKPVYPMIAVTAATQAVFVLSQPDRRLQDTDGTDYKSNIGLRIYRSRAVALGQKTVGAKQNVSNPFKNL